MKIKFSTHWKSSTQLRKQRKYRYNAPLHIKQKFMHVHLAPVLRDKYGLRNIQVKTGDRVKVMRGQFKSREGKVEKVNLKKEKIHLAGIEIIKKDGSKIQVGISPSNVMIVELDLAGKKRKLKLEKAKISSSTSSKSVKPAKLIKGGANAVKVRKSLPAQAEQK